MKRSEYKYGAWDRTIPSVVLAPGDSMEVKVEAEDFDEDNAKIDIMKDSPTGMRILRNGL